MSRLPWFPFYPADWLADDRVACMTLAEQGAYIRLLAYAWRNAGALPAHSARIAGMLGVSESEADAMLAGPLGECWPCSKDGTHRVNPRLSRICEAQDADRAKRSQAARNAAAKRWQCERNAKSCQSESESESDTESDPPTDVGGAGGDPPSGRGVKRPKSGRAKVRHWDALLEGPRYAVLRSGPKSDSVVEWTAHLATRLPRAHTEQGARKALDRILDMTDAQFAAAVAHSIEQNYQGLYEPRNGTAPAAGRGGDSILDMIDRGEVTLDEPVEG